MSQKELKCSFCGKTQDAVGKLISSPKESDPRAYICNECICVCVDVLEGPPPEVQLPEDKFPRRVPIWLAHMLDRGPKSK